MAAVPDLDVLPELLPPAPSVPSATQSAPFVPHNAENVALAAAPAPAPVPAPAPAPAPYRPTHAAPAPAADPLTSPLHVLATAPAAPAAAPAPAAPSAVATAEAPQAPFATPSGPPTWPCLGCGARNSMDANACQQCARPFLPMEDTFGFSLPGIGKVSNLDKPQRAFIAIGGIVIVTLLFVALAFLVSAVL